MAGDSLLTVAQELKLTEKQVRQYMEEALSMQTDLMRDNAELFQQFFFLQHQEMYRTARRMCMPQDPETGDNSAAADLYWFREMRAQLKEMQLIVEKYMSNAADANKSVNITILEADDFYALAASLRGNRNVNLLDGS